MIELEWSSYTTFIWWIFRTFWNYLISSISHFASATPTTSWCFIAISLCNSLPFLILSHFSCWSSLPLAVKIVRAQHRSSLFWNWKILFYPVETCQRSHINIVFEQHRISTTRQSQYHRWTTGLSLLYINPSSLKMFAIIEWQKDSLKKRFEP